MAVYSNIYVVLNGQLLAESVSVETSLQRPSDPIFSITGNFEGISTGPLVRQIVVQHVIPSSGSELRFEEMMRTNEKVEIMLQEGASWRLCISRGHFTGVSRGAGVCARAGVSFPFVGTATTLV